MDFNAAKKELQVAIFDRDAEKAARQWQALISQDPAFTLPAGLQFDLCRVLTSGGHFRESLEAYENLLSRFPEAPVAFPSRLEYARLCSDFPERIQQGVHYIREFLDQQPPGIQRDEAQGILDRLQLSAMGIQVNGGGAPGVSGPSVGQQPAYAPPSTPAPPVATPGVHPDPYGGGGALPPMGHGGVLDPFSDQHVGPARQPIGLYGPGPDPRRAPHAHPGGDPSDTGADGKSMISLPDLAMSDDSSFEGLGKVPSAAPLPPAPQGIAGRGFGQAARETPSPPPAFHRPASPSPSPIPSAGVGGEGSFPQPGPMQPGYNAPSLLPTPHPPMAHPPSLPAAAPPPLSESKLMPKVKPSWAKSKASPPGPSPEVNRWANQAPPPPPVQDIAPRLLPHAGGGFAPAGGMAAPPSPPADVYLPPDAEPPSFETLAPPAPPPSFAFPSHAVAPPPLPAMGSVPPPPPPVASAPLLSPQGIGYPGGPVQGGYSAGFGAPSPYTDRFDALLDMQASPLSPPEQAPPPVPPAKSSPKPPPKAPSAPEAGRKPAPSPPSGEDLQPPALEGLSFDIEPPATEELDDRTRTLEVQKFQKEQEERQNRQAYEALLQTSRFAAMLPVGKRIHFEATCQVLASFLDIDPSSAKRKLRRGKGIILQDLSYDDMVEFYHTLLDCPQKIVFVRQAEELDFGAVQPILSAQPGDKSVRVTTEKGMFRVEWDRVKLVSAGWIKASKTEDNRYLVADLISESPNRHLRLMDGTFNYRSWFGPDAPPEGQRFRVLAMELAKQCSKAEVSHSIRLITRGESEDFQVFTSAAEFDNYNRWLLLSRFGELIDPARKRSKAATHFS